MFAAGERWKPPAGVRGRALARNGAYAYGLDFLPRHCKLPASPLQFNGEHHANFVQGDAHSLPFPDHCFDLVVSCETVEHLPFLELSLAEFRRVTRPVVL